VTNALIETPYDTAKSLGWSLAGIPIYYIWKRGRKT
jgi:hypothetical protein